eukprot:Selendium_serpulae@DN852_c0_g1_i1.p1
MYGIAIHYLVTSALVLNPTKMASKTRDSLAATEFKEKPSDETLKDYLEKAIFPIDTSRIRYGRRGRESIWSKELKLTREGSYDQCSNQSSKEKKDFKEVESNDSSEEENEKRSSCSNSSRLFSTNKNNENSNDEHLDKEDEINIKAKTNKNKVEDKNREISKKRKQEKINTFVDNKKKDHEEQNNKRKSRKRISDK